MDEIREITETQEEAKKEKGEELNPFAYVTIPVKEYKKLIIKAVKKDLKRKYKAMYEAEINAAQADRETYRKWYYEEKEAAQELRANLDAAKAHIAELVGVTEVKTDADDGR